MLDLSPSEAFFIFTITSVIIYFAYRLVQRR